MERETTLACLKPPETPVFLAQEFQALKVAMEENLSPALSFQNELNFTKCTQAVSAMKDMLSAACKNQWHHLQGKGIDGLSFQETEEGLCSSGGHPVALHPPRVGGGCLQARWLLRALAPLPPALEAARHGCASRCTIPIWAYASSLRFYDFFPRRLEAGEATNSLGVRQGPAGGGKWPKWPPVKGDSFFPG